MSGFWALTNEQGKAGVRYVMQPLPFDDEDYSLDDVVLNAGSACDAVNLAQCVNSGGISFDEIERSNFAPFVAWLQNAKVSRGETAPEECAAGPTSALPLG